MLSQSWDTLSIPVTGKISYGDRLAMAKYGRAHSMTDSQMIREGLELLLEGGI